MEIDAAGSEVAVAEVLREDAQAEQSHDLDPFVAPREPVADERLVDAAVLARERDEAVVLVAEHDRVQRGFLAAFVTEQRHRDGPPSVHRADDVVLGDARAVEEHLVELAAAR